MFNSTFWSGKTRKFFTRTGVAVLFVLLGIGLQAQLLPGNIVVLRAGDGAAALSSAAQPTFLDQYNSSGSLINTVALPTSGGSALTIGGTSTTEGFISLSGDGSVVVIPGYKAAAGTSGVGSTTASSVNRAVGMVNASGTFSIPTSSASFFSSNSIRGAAAENNNNFWGAGGSTGTVYFGNGSSAATLQSTVSNTRAIGVYAGALYTSTTSTTPRILKIGTGLPKTTGQTVGLVFTATGGTGTPDIYAFYFNADTSICYVADGRSSANGGGVQKYTRSGSVWSLAYTLSAGSTGCHGVIADFSGSVPVVYATTTSASNNAIVKIVDNGSAGSSTTTTIATAGTNKWFRGLAFAPISAPTVQASSLVFSGTTSTSTTVTCTRGNGAYRIIKMNTSNSFTSPVANTLYTGNSVYAGGEQVIYAGNDSTVSVSNLSASTTYHFRVYEYNSNGLITAYNTTTASGNPASTTTLSAATPSIVVVESINNFGNVRVGQSSAEQTYTVSGTALTDSITITAPAGFQISRTSGSGFGTTVKLGPSAGVVSSTTIYIRFTPSGTGAASGSVTHASTGATTQSFTVDGTGVVPALNVTASPPFAFGNIPVSFTSGVQSFTISGTNLASDITVTAPTGFVVSDSFNTGYASSKTITVSGTATPAGGTLSIRSVYVRFAPTALGLHTGNVTVATSGVTTTNIAVTGTGVATPVLTELVVPQYMGSKTASSTNDARTPIAVCLQLTSLEPNTTYHIQAGLGITSDAASSYGAGNIWNGTAFSGQVDSSAFTSDASGNSGPFWVVLQPTGNSSRFDAGQIHNLRIGYAPNGSAMPNNPYFIGSKTITALDIATSARTVSTADDGAFLKGTANTCNGGRYVLVYDNTTGSGDPLYAYQIRPTDATNGTQSQLPTAINAVFNQVSPSVTGDFAAVIPIGANNSNGVRRIEARNSANVITSFNSDADGVWPSTANTTTVARRGVVTLTNTDAPLTSGTAVLSGSFSVCSGDSANVIIDLAGIAPFSFTVTDGLNTYGPFSTSAIKDTIAVALPSPGNYTYTLASATDASCPLNRSGSTSVSVRPTPSAFISGTLTTCANAGSQTITFSNPTSEAITVTYNVNAGPSQTINVPANGTNSVSQSLANAGVFTYTLESAVLQTGSPSCLTSLSGTATVTVNANPVAGILGTTSGCTSVTLTATGGTMYSWSGGSNPSNAINTFNSSNTYSVTVTDANNCSATTSTPVTISCSVWLGNNSNWHDPSNWATGNVPVACTTDVIIGTTANNPVINSLAAVRNVTISGNVTLTLNANLNVCGNWSGDAVVTGNGEVVFNRNLTGDQLISGNTEFNNLTVARPSGFVRTRLNTSNLSVRSAVRLVSGNFASTAVPLTLLSTATHTAYVDDFSMSYTGKLIGKVNMQRYANGVGGGTTTQHQIATGLSGVDVKSSFQSSLSLSGADGQFLTPNANCNGLLSGSPYANLLQWSPGAVSTCLLQGYQTKTSGFTQQGVGYAANVPNNTTLTYRGYYAAGPFAVPAVNTGNATQNGYNFIGNPYLSAVTYTAQSGFDANGLIFVPSGDYTGTYQTLTPGTAIASSQGFWVRVTNPGTTSYNFTNSMRVTGNPTWYRTAKENMVTLELSSAGFKDLTTIAFAEEAEKGWDAAYDAGKLLSQEGQPTLYTLVEGQMASLNTLKNATITPSVPVGVHFTGKGKATITAKDMLLPEGYELLLEDKTTGTWHDLRANPAYVYQEEGNTSLTSTRFVLHFRKAASVEEQVNIFSSENKVYVDFNNLSAVDATIEIYNIMGQKLTEGIMQQSGIWSHELNGSEAFYAVVKVNNRGVMQSRKVMIQPIR